MNTNFLNLKTRVMTRIYLRYIKNTFMERSDYFMFAIFVIVSYLLISIHDVLNNIPKNDMSSAFNFFLVAVRNTSWIIQVLIAGLFIRACTICAKLLYKNTMTNRLLAKFRY